MSRPFGLGEPSRARYTWPLWSDGVKGHPAGARKDFALAGARPRGSGFWKGLLTGVALAALVALALAYVFPPTRYFAPEVLPNGGPAPAVPGTPSAIVEPRAPGAGALLPDAAPAPLIAIRPAAEPTPGMPSLAPTPAPDVFLGAPSGSPSLVPR